MLSTSIFASDVARIPRRSYRFERKYYLTLHEADILKRRISCILRPDVHSGGVYHVTSVYFDDIFNTSFHQKQSGVLLRNKLRLRYYNHNLDFIRLEHKHKYGEMISKQSAPVSPEQFRSIRNGDYDLARDAKHPVLQLLYAKRQSVGLAPVVNVDYDREVFTHEPGNVRITFDAGLRAAPPFSELSMPALAPGLLVLEVKYDHFLPLVIAEMLSSSKLTQMAVSKYTMCREVLMHAHLHPPGTVWDRLP